VRDAETFYPRLGELTLQHQLLIFGFQSPDNNLESVFQYLVGG